MDINVVQMSGVSLEDNFWQIKPESLDLLSVTSEEG